MADLLGTPEEYLVAKNETICVTRMGFKQDGLTDDATELTYTELRNAEGRSLVVVMLSLEGAELREFLQ